METKIAAKWTG